MKILLACVIVFIGIFPIASAILGYMMGRKKLIIALLAGIGFCIFPVSLCGVALWVLQDRFYAFALLFSIIGAVLYLIMLIAGKASAKKNPGNTVLAKISPVLIVITVFIVSIIGGVVWNVTSPSYIDSRADGISYVYWRFDLQRHPMPTVKTDTVKDKQYEKFVRLAQEQAKKGTVNFDEQEKYLGRYLDGDTWEYSAEDIQNATVFERLCMVKIITSDFFENFEKVTASMTEDEKAAHTENYLAVFQVLCDEAKAARGNEIARGHRIIADMYKSVRDYLAENAKIYCCYDELFRRELEKLYPAGPKMLIDDETAQARWERAKGQREYYLSGATAKQALERITES